MSQHPAAPSAPPCLDATAAFTLATGIKVPGQREAREAWLSLTAEARDRIGTLAVDHILQMFLADDDHEPARSPLRGNCRAESEAHIRADVALTELWHLIEDQLPDIFGTVESGPAWAKGQDQ